MGVWFKLGMLKVVRSATKSSQMKRTLFSIVFMFSPSAAVQKQRDQWHSRFRSSRLRLVAGLCGLQCLTAIWENPRIVPEQDVRVLVGRSGDVLGRA